MLCAECKTDNREGRRFCRECGAMLFVSCSACDFPNELGDKYCGGCGASMSVSVPAPDPAHAAASPLDRSIDGVEVEAASATSDAEPASATPNVQAAQQLQLVVPPSLSPRREAEPAGERRQVTALFADMAGFTSASESLGEERTYKMMGPVFEAMIDAVRGNEGTVQELTGDGIMALFGAPIAIEDAPLRACRAALAIQERMDRLGPELESEYGVHPRLRIGVHTGPVVVGGVGDDKQMEFTALGDTLNLASRLESLAEPGRVLISDVTRRLVDGLVVSRDLGERRIKGKAAAHRVHQLEGVGSGSDRFEASLHRGLTPFVGRSAELAALDRAAERAAEGAVRVVNVVGEAGIGKSRLVYEFQRRLDRERFFFLRGGCMADGQSTAFSPFIEVIKTSFRIGDGLGPDEVSQKIARGLDRLGLGGGDALPLLQNLLSLQVTGDALRGLDGEIVGSRTREVLRSALYERCALSPVVMLIEDGQWIDSASEELLEQIIGSGGNRPLLVICTCRPGYESPWAGHEAATMLRLAHLSAEDTAALVRGRIGEHAFNDEIRQLITDKAEGNPLFAEEIARYVHERCAPANGAHGVGAIAASGVPGSLRDILMARVDRLEDGPRTVLQAASVIGRRFPMELVEPVAQLNGHLPQFLSALEREDLIVRPAPERAEYSFAQALVQDAVYDSLLSDQRQSMHRRAAEAIEQLHSDHLGEWADSLAHHYGRSNRDEKALRYLALAGRRSLGVYALDEAGQRFERAAEIVDKATNGLDRTAFFDMVIDWVRLFYYRKDFPGMIALVERFLPQVEQEADRRNLSLLLFWRAFAKTMDLRDEEAREELKRALALGEEIGDDECIGYACMGQSYLDYGNIEPDVMAYQRATADRGVEIAERLGDVYLSSKCDYAFLMRLMFAGQFAEARQRAERMLALGRKAGDPRTMSMAFYSLAFLDAFSERYDDAIENAEEALRLSPDPLDKTVARMARGMALALMGKGEEALQDLSASRDAADSGGMGMLRTGIDMTLGAALMLTGELGRGLGQIEEARVRFQRERRSGPVAIAEVVLGEIYLQIARGEAKASAGTMLRNLGFVLTNVPFAAKKARKHLWRAIAIGRKYGMGFHLARCLFDIAEFEISRGKPAAAMPLLEEAREIAEAQGLDAYVARIDTARTAHA